MSRERGRNKSWDPHQGDEREFVLHPKLAERTTTRARPTIEDGSGDSGPIRRKNGQA